MNMDNAGSGQEQTRLPLSVPFYYGWFIVALSFLANLTAAGIRSAPSVLIHPLEAEFGWSRTAIATAASLNLLLLGLFAPIGGWLIDRIGARRVIFGCLTAIVAGLISTVFVQELWELIFLWGVVLGIATGVTPPLGASIASPPSSTPPRHAMPAPRARVTPAAIPTPTPHQKNNPHTS
jgi:MFS family permease